MQRYRNWFLVLLKAQSKKISFWCLILIMIFVTMMIHTCSLPRENNTVVYLCYENLKGEDLALSKRIVEYLKQKDSIYEFRVADTKEDLKTHILQADGQAGVVFTPGIYEACVQQKIKGVMEFYHASFSSTKEIVGETVFSAFFAEYSKIVLLESVDEIYQEPSEELKEQLLQRTQEYLNGTSLFSIHKIGYEEALEQETVPDVWPVRGMLGLFLFLSIYLVMGEKKDLFQKYLNGRQKALYLLLKCLVMAIPVELVSLLLLTVSGQRRGPVEEMLAFLLTFVMSFLEGWILLMLMRKENRYLAAICPLTLVNLLLCPIFFDLSKIVSAVSVIRYLFPAYYYVVKIWY